MTGTARESSPYRVADTCRRAADEIERLEDRIETQKGVILNHVENERRLTAVSEERAVTARALHEHLGKTLQERDEWKAAAQEACDENNALRAERDAARADHARVLEAEKALVAELQGTKDELHSVDKAAKELGAERDRLTALLDSIRKPGYSGAYSAEMLSLHGEINRLRAALEQYTKCGCKILANGDCASSTRSAVGGSFDHRCTCKCHVAREALAGGGEK